MINNYSGLNLPNQQTQPQQNFQNQQVINPMANILQNPTMNIFPQPDGNVYVLNSMNEIGNIPTSSGITIGICLNENTLAIKSIQNGAPAQLTYKLVAANNTPQLNEEKDDLKDTLKSHKLKIESLERQMQRITEKVGGKLEW